MKQDDVVIVLSRPEEAGNVGAVCRAMKNMGLSRLRLAAPDFSSQPRSGSLSEAGYGYGGPDAVIRARAVHAEDVWERAETFASLGAAVADCAMVIGTTRRRGRRRKQVSMTPAETAAFLQSHPGPAALVFGNERTGLEDKELELCNFATHIPVDEAFPSLNLSHAVQIYAYEIFKGFGGSENPAAIEAPPAVKGQWVPMDQPAIAALVEEVTNSLLSLGFYRQRGREEQELFFRDVFSRAALTEREGRYFGDIIAKAARLAAKGSA
ncbi:RNA methyltransferase [Leadbettera azotonutricia]|uniref:RNA methyltransferase, TrmH family n=1 Tax=Leadbettera azotonutricia (strain ATCC BAA-888 / DSM 13862 / ZAS-9) TaxID=545695 RepID=F5YDQ7_LEAAZ|nr:TrmH family RNA methyltransferase [Leadbettera azotonutricia]AEF81240.1 RNA methyltransferase, TrmH family [Leadbettera azotonutricia ZAS-9]